jgi:hypothetical protein
LNPSRDDQGAVGNQRWTRRIPCWANDRAAQSGTDHPGNWAPVYDGLIAVDAIPASQLFLSGDTRSIECRAGQLIGLRSMMQNHAEAFYTSAVEMGPALKTTRTVATWCR